MADRTFLRELAQTTRVKQHTPEKYAAIKHELDSMNWTTCGQTPQNSATQSGPAHAPQHRAGQKANCRCWQLRPLVTHGGAQTSGVTHRPAVWHQALCRPATGQGCPPRRRFCGHAQGNAQWCRPNKEPRQGRGSARKSLLPCPGGAKSHQAKLNKLT